MKQLLLYTFLIISPFGFAQTGPGGVGNNTSNVLWVRSEDINLNDGDIINTWTDYSTHSNTLTQSDNSIAPHFKTDIANSYPVARFDQDNNRIRKTDFNDFPAGQITVIYVNKTQDDSEGILSYASSASDNDFLLYGSEQIAPHVHDTKPDPLPNIAYNDNVWHIANVSWEKTNNNVEVWKDGSKDYTDTINYSNDITADGCFAVAGEQDGVDSGYSSKQSHQGDFTEIIIYNEYINKSQHIIVSNYLSAKYDITLAANDFFTQDDNSNGDFDFNVAGIGQADDGSNHTDSQGTGIIKINNPSNLSNDTYLFWGEDTKDATYDFTQIDSDTYRINTKWRVSKQNDLGDVSLAFEQNDINLDASVLKCATLKLIISTQNDFSNKTAYLLNLNSGTYSVDNINFADGDYFSIEYSVDKTTWDGSNWSESAPDLSKYAVFSEDYDMDSQNSISACSCQVNSGKTVHISDNKYLEVSYDIKNEGEIIVENQGALVQTDSNASISGSGSFKLNKTSLTLDNYWEYVYWSSPINSNNFTLGDLINNAWRYYKFDPAEANNGHAYPGWVMLSATDKPLKGIGYAISAPTGTASGTTLNVQFYHGSDPFNNGEIVVNVYKKGGPDNIGDFNLVGNPYPSAIDFDALINDTDNSDVEGAYSLWTNCKGLDSNGHHQTDGYATYSVSGTGTNACNDNSLQASRYIASGQGFMIEAKNDNSNMKFKNAYRVTDHNDGFLNRNTNVDIAWIDLLDNNGNYNQIAVGFYPGATNQYDRLFDATSMNTGSGFALYSIVDNKKLAIQGLTSFNGNDRIVPLGIESDIARNISIHLNKTEGLVNQKIYLRDLYLNIIHDLKNADYNTTVSAGDFTDRFELIFSQRAMSIDDVIDPNAVLLTQQTGTFTLVSNNEMNITGVTVYDITGKVLYNNQDIDTTMHQLDLQQIATGNMLLFRVQMNNESIIVKKAIKQ